MTSQHCSRDPHKAYRLMESPMAIMTIAPVAASAARLGANLLCQTENRDVWWDTHWGRSGAVITVHGEVNTANAGALGRCVQRCAGYCEWLVLDLSDLEFTDAVTALSALHSITDRCAAVGVDWAMVPGPAVFRLLRSHTSGWVLPIGESLTDALAAVQARLYATVLDRTTEPKPAPDGLDGDRNQL